jgi:hypothetical protein
MDTWQIDAYKMIEVLKQIRVFCDTAYKIADYSKWTLKPRQIDVFTDLVLEGSINILYPDELKGKYNVWVEIDLIKKEPKSEGDNETLNTLIPEATKIMETILGFIKTIKAKD